MTRQMSRPEILVSQLPVLFMLGLIGSAFLVGVRRFGAEDSTLLKYVCTIGMVLFFGGFALQLLRVVHALLSTPGEPLDLSLHRSHMTNKFQARALDVTLAGFVCPRCEAPVADPDHRIAGAVDYRSLDELLSASEGVAKKIVSGSPRPACSGCRRVSTLVRLDYHLFHSDRQRDLVVRHQVEGDRSLKSTQLLWWTYPDSESPAELSDEDLECLRRDALLRSVELSFQASGQEAGLEALRGMRKEIPADRRLVELLCYVPLDDEPLLKKIAGAVRKEHPDYPNTYVELGDRAVDRADRTDPDDEALYAKASKYYQRALRLSGGKCPPAEKGLAWLLYKREKRGEAKQAFQDLMEKYPQDLQIHVFAARLCLLLGDPQLALDALAAFEGLKPYDSELASLAEQASASGKR